VTYLDEDADLIRRHLPANADPPSDADALFLIYALLLRSKGATVSPADVHDAWSVWMLTTHGDHKSVVPFAELDSDVQAEDAPYVVAIRSAARSCTVSNPDGSLVTD
jgi:hypothetical protein